MWGSDDFVCVKHLVSHSKHALSTSCYYTTSTTKSILSITNKISSHQEETTCTSFSEMMMAWPRFNIWSKRTESSFPQQKHTNGDQGPRYSVLWATKEVIVSRIYPINVNCVSSPCWTLCQVNLFAHIQHFLLYSSEPRALFPYWSMLIIWRKCDIQTFPRMKLTRTEEGTRNCPLLFSSL